MRHSFECPSPRLGEESVNCRFASVLTAEWAHIDKELRYIVSILMRSISIDYEHNKIGVLSTSIDEGIESCENEMIWCTIDLSGNSLDSRK
jgi:hypothetical protein